MKDMILPGDAEVLRLAVRSDQLWRQRIHPGQGLVGNLLAVGATPQNRQTTEPHNVHLMLSSVSSCF